jgi:hypothetical protein
MEQSYKCAFIFVEDGKKLTSQDVGESLGCRVLYGPGIDSLLPTDISMKLRELKEIIQILDLDFIDSKPKHRDPGKVVTFVFEDTVPEVMLHMKHDVIARTLISNRSVDDILRSSRDLSSVEAMHISIVEHLSSLQEYEADDFDTSALGPQFENWKERAEEIFDALSEAKELKLKGLIRLFNSGWDTTTA